MAKYIILLCVFPSALGSILEPPALRKLRENPLFPHGRIVGGVETDIREVPYQAGLEYYGFQFCGGSLVSEDHVVTAAHCLIVTVIDLQVRVGSSQSWTGGIVRPVTASYVHPQYSSNALDYDVAVLKLAEKVPLSDSVRPIPISVTEASVGSYFKLSGWGLLSEDGKKAEKLHSVSIPVISRNKCQEMYSSFDINITKRMVCAYELGKDSCQGDSGGPAAVNGVLHGIVSFGVGCARPNYAGVYTNVADPDIRAFIRHYAKV